MAPPKGCISNRKGVRLSDETKAKLREAAIARYLRGENPIIGKPHHDSTRIKISELAKKRCEDPDYRRRMSHPCSEALKSRLRRLRSGTSSSYECRVRMSETRLGGHWYGNVRYWDGDKLYCEKWNRHFRARVRAFWGHQSVLSGRTSEENGKKKALLTVHHVYYQKKACCIWDEDANGYYAIIDGERYYIDGDPNKFVLLTSGENSMVNHNKMKWVKIFEQIIKDAGGKCYFTSDEMAVLKRGVCGRSPPAGC